MTHYPRRESRDKGRGSFVPLSFSIPGCCVGVLCSQHDVCTQQMIIAQCDNDWEVCKHCTVVCVSDVPTAVIEQHDQGT